jgi:hypothetical protein
MEIKEPMMSKVKITYIFNDLPNIYFHDNLTNLEPIVYPTNKGEVKIYFMINAEEIKNIKAGRQGVINVIAVEINPKNQININETQWYIQFEDQIKEIFFKFYRLLRKKLPHNNIPMLRNPKYRVNIEILNRPAEYTGSDRQTYIGVSLKKIEKYFDANDWSDLKKEMLADTEPEIWEEFLMDARVGLDNHDYDSAVISAAIAGEVFIKNTINHMATTHHISSLFIDYINSQEPDIKILRYFGPLLHLVTGHSFENENTELYNAVKRIFNKRNKVMHEGRRIVSDDERIQLRKDINALEEAMQWVLHCCKESHLDL